MDDDNFDDNITEIAPFVRKVVFDEGITGIGQMAFSRFDYIKNVEFSDTVTEVGVAKHYEDAFKYISATDKLFRVGFNL